MSTSFLIDILYKMHIILVLYIEDQFTSIRLKLTGNIRNAIV